MDYKAQVYSVLQMLPIFQNDFYQLTVPPSSVQVPEGFSFVLIQCGSPGHGTYFKLIVQNILETQVLLIKNKEIDLDNYLYLSCETPSLCCLCPS